MPEVLRAHEGIKLALLLSCVTITVTLATMLYNPVRWKSKINAPAGSTERAPQTTVPAKTCMPANLEDFLAVYGPPTLVEPGQANKLRPSPAAVTRWLDYEPEHLRVAFVAVTGPTAKREWIAISVVDSKDTLPLSFPLAERRLSSRRKLGP